MENIRYADKECEHVRDTPEVRLAISSIYDVICRYNGVVERLSNKLSCVTIPAHPITTNSKLEPSFKTALANDLDNLRIRLKDITDELESIYDGLEI